MPFMGQKTKYCRMMKEAHFTMKLHLQLVQLGKKVLANHWILPRRSKTKVLLG